MDKIACFFSDPSFLSSKRWICGKLSILGPDTWTGLRIPLFTAAALFLEVSSYTEAFICIALGIITDIIDGAVARHLGVQGRVFGCVFDAIVDRIILVPIWQLLDGFVPLSFFLGFCALDLVMVPLARVSIGSRGNENMAVHLVIGKIKFFVNFTLFYVLWTAKCIFPEWCIWNSVVEILFSVVVFLSVAEATKWENNFR